MAFVSHIPIEVVGMPERPGPADLNIGALGGEGLPASDDLAQGKAIQHLDYDVNVVRHEAPSQQSIAFSIEVERVPPVTTIFGTKQRQGVPPCVPAQTEYARSRGENSPRRFYHSEHFPSACAIWDRPPSSAIAAMCLPEFQEALTIPWWSRSAPNQQLCSWLSPVRPIYQAFWPKYEIALSQISVK